jgi:hypothetical protein
MLSKSELEQLESRIVAGIQEYFDNYDWDAKFIQHFEK